MMQLGIHLMREHSYDDQCWGHPLSEAVERG
jgi:hypothetical protein